MFVSTYLLLFSNTSKSRSTTNTIWIIRIDTKVGIVRAITLYRSSCCCIKLHLVSITFWFSFLLNNVIKEGYKSNLCSVYRSVRLYRWYVFSVYRSRDCTEHGQSVRRRGGVRPASGDRRPRWRRRRGWGTGAGRAALVRVPGKRFMLYNCNVLRFLYTTRHPDGIRRHSVQMARNGDSEANCSRLWLNKQN